VSVLGDSGQLQDVGVRPASSRVSRPGDGIPDLRSAGACPLPGPRLEARRRDQDLGVWTLGFLQFVTGIILFVGLRWFVAFTQKPPYMPALAFTARGVHWFALGPGRTFCGDTRPSAFMAIPFTVLPALGAVVFFGTSDNAIGGLFVGLLVIYVREFFAGLRLASANLGRRSATEMWGRALGLVQSDSWMQKSHHHLEAAPSPRFYSVTAESKGAA
jgi:hypothetical protein